MMKRALAAERISVKKDDSTSIERQEQVTTGRIRQEGLELVGRALDENVSATKVNPFKRPQLGSWLNERVGDFDVLVFWRVDRAVRSMADLHQLMGWAKEYRKRIIICEGPGSEYDYDFSGQGDEYEAKLEMAMLLATVIAWAARIESQAIRDRVKSSHAYLRREGEWGGGMVPYGLKPQRKKGAKRGWELVSNPETMPVLLEIVERVLDGERLLPICKSLNDEGVPTPRDYWEKKKAEERAAEADEVLSPSEDDESRKWSTPGLKVILTSRHLLGEWIFDGSLNVDEAGEPIARCEPILSRAKWNDLQEAVATLSMSSKQKYSEPNPVLGIAFCARCGLPYYLKQERQKGRLYSNLSCRSRHGDQHTSCGQSTISLTYANEIITQTTMMLIGRFEATKRIFVPGDDRSEELTGLKARVIDLEEEYDQGLLPDRARYIERKRKLISRIDAVGPDPVKQSGYKWIGTGKTYEQIWPGLDSQQRLKLLRDLGIKVYLGRGESDAAQKAYSDLENADGHRLSLVMNPEESNEMLETLQDGTRVKKDLAVWYLQTAEAPIHELLSRSDTPKE